MYCEMEQRIESLTKAIHLLEKNYRLEIERKKSARFLRSSLRRSAHYSCSARNQGGIPR